MANPLYNLEDGLQRLNEERDRLLGEQKVFKNRLENLEKDILKFKNAIKILKKEN